MQWDAEGNKQHNGRWPQGQKHGARDKTPQGVGGAKEVLRKRARKTSVLPSRLTAYYSLGCLDLLLKLLDRTTISAVDFNLHSLCQ